MSIPRGSISACLSRAASPAVCCLWLSLAAASPAAAAPAQPGTLQDYIDLGAAGATIGSTLFSDFELLPNQNFANQLSPQLIQVTPFDSPTGPSLLFTVNDTVGSGVLDEIRIGYSVSGSTLQGASESIGGASALGDGAVTSVEDVSIDPGPPVATIITFVTANDALLSDQLSLLSDFYFVQTDIVVDGGLAGSAALGSVTNGFILATPAVPEPGTLALLAAAAGLLTCRRPRRRTGTSAALGLAAALTCLLTLSPAQASSHREAPITALDHKADITDFYAFRSYDGGAVPRVTFVLCVDPFLDPANGPNWFPFDPDILYEIKIDNNNDALEDIVFQFHFNLEERLPNLFQVYAGAGAGVTAPGNSPAPVPPGALVVPPQITSFSSSGLGMRQSYTVTMVKGGVSTPITGAGSFFAVPANVGPRTMNYDALFAAGTYHLGSGISVFAGTTDDPFWIDLGGAFDTLNLRSSVNSGVLSPAQDAALQNFASDTVSGYAVNSIAIEVPVSMLTRTGAVEAANSTAATIGAWGTTSRTRILVRRPPLPASGSGGYRQVQRLANPLINELIIGTGFKDRFSMDIPSNDSQFASFFLDPALARVLNALTGGAVAIPAPPRLDLLPLVTYAPPIAAPGTPAGPIADLMRLNTGVNPTPPANASRLGLLGGDPAGYPNGRRLFDDVTDISLRAVAGVLNPAFNKAPNNMLGDGVNVNDAPYRTSFPYLANCPSGRDRRHIDPGEAGCTGGAGSPCPP